MRGCAVLAMLLLVAACGDLAEQPATTTVPATTMAPTTTAAPTTTTLAPTTTAAATTTVAPTTTGAPTTTAAGPVISLGEPGDDGLIEVVVDRAGLAPLFNAYTAGADPLYLVHTQQDDLFVGIELYTVFGDGWTGEPGLFPADCTTHGICVYLDPDGTGPLPGMGPGNGTVTVVALDEDAGTATVTIEDVIFTDDEGQTFAIVGLTLGE